MNNFLISVSKSLSTAPASDKVGWKKREILGYTSMSMVHIPNICINSYEKNLNR